MQENVLGINNGDWTTHCSARGCNHLILAMRIKDNVVMYKMESSLCGKCYKKTE